MFNTKARNTLGPKQGENWGSVHPNLEFSQMNCIAKKCSSELRIKGRSNNKKCLLSCVILKIFLDVIFLFLTSLLKIVKFFTVWCVVKMFWLRIFSGFSDFYCSFCQLFRKFQINFLVMLYLFWNLPALVPLSLNLFTS